MTLAQKLLRVLDSAPRPVPTPDLLRFVFVRGRFPRARVWCELQRLERSGLVRRTGSVPRRGYRGAHRVTLWAVIMPGAARAGEPPKPSEGGPR